jgi:hypothetical protein
VALSPSNAIALLMAAEHCCANGCAVCTCTRSATTMRTLRVPDHTHQLPSGMRTFSCVAHLELHSESAGSELTSEHTSAMPVSSLGVHWYCTAMPPPGPPCLRATNSNVNHVPAAKSLSQTHFRRERARYVVKCAVGAGAVSVLAGIDEFLYRRDTLPNIGGVKSRLCVGAQTQLPLMNTKPGAYLGAQSGKLENLSAAVATAHSRSPVRAVLPGVAAARLRDC